MAELQSPLQDLADSLGWTKGSQKDSKDNLESLAEHEPTKATLLKLFSLAEQFRNRNAQRGDLRPQEIEVSVTNAEGVKSKISVPQEKTSPAGMFKPEVNLISIVVKDANNKVTQQIDIRRWPKSGQVLVSYATLDYAGRLEQQTYRDAQGDYLKLMTPPQAETFLPDFKKVEQLLEKATNLNQTQEYQPQMNAVAKTQDEIEFREAGNRLESVRASENTIALAYELYTKFEAQEGFTTGDDEIPANEQEIAVSYNGKTYKVKVPKCGMRQNREGQPVAPFEVNVTLTEVRDEIVQDFMNLNFQNEPQTNAWNFRSNTVKDAVHISEATRLDPKIKLAEQILKVAVDQAEKKLLENPNYKADERQTIPAQEPDLDDIPNI